ARILALFGLPVDARYLSEVGRSPVLTRYSKAPEYGYTPEVRAEILRESRRDHREEIRRGLAWLERVTHANPAVATLMSSTTSG
ncbi:MAG TPA: hypothetical protein VET86_09850, partial [Casimicrobiaceae bacterium]|nr:hypothetical protein [Casimicrobiaceae bacterium]